MRVTSLKQPSQTSTMWVCLRPSSYVSGVGPVNTKDLISYAPCPSSCAIYIRRIHNHVCLCLRLLTFTSIPQISLWNTMNQDMSLSGYTMVTTSISPALKCRAIIKPVTLYPLHAHRLSTNAETLHRNCSLHLCALANDRVRSG